MKAKHLLILLSLTLLGGCSIPQEAMVIHVSPAGDDSATGAANAPLLSLQEAQLRARIHVGQMPVTVLCADGIYYLDTSLVLTPEDSGTAEAPVIYRRRTRGRPS